MPFGKMVDCYTPFPIQIHFLLVINGNLFCAFAILQSWRTYYPLDTDECMVCVCVYLIRIFGISM